MMDMNYVYIGLVATFVWFLVSLYAQRKPLYNSIYSASIFAFIYIVGYVVFNNTPNIMENFGNVQMYGLVMTLIWFALVLIVQKKSVPKALLSAGKFLIFFILGDFTYQFIAKNM